MWHTTEVALGLLSPGEYFPKREAMDDVRALLYWYDSLHETATHKDEAIG